MRASQHDTTGTSGGIDERSTDAGNPRDRSGRTIATGAHKGQTDKIGAPYIEHPAMVAFLVQLLPEFEAAAAGVQEAAVCAAWLHDVIEDTAVTSDSLKDLGFSPEVLTAVTALTRRLDVEGDAYYSIIRFLPIARMVKSADIASNLVPERVQQLDEATRARLDGKYSRALEKLSVSRSVITELHKVATARRAPTDGVSGAPRRPVIDLHTHSTRSDGSDSPRDLVFKAHQVGITHLAITDHDTTAGWDEAAEAAGRVGIELVRGIELTTRNEGRGLHLLAYEPDPTHPALAELLRRAGHARRARIPLMVQRIAVKVPALLLEEVQRIAGNASPGRPHIADALVQCRACTDRTDAFERYLDRGLDTYVTKWAPNVEDVIQTVAAAGGVSVVAHPWGKKEHITRRRFEQLRACGLRGVEVNHLEHDAPARAELKGIADELGLVITGSSDYHGTGKLHNHLACETTEWAEFEKLKLGLRVIA